MTQKKAWSTPALHTHGSAAAITKNIIDFKKEIGTGDSILLIVGNTSSIISSPTGGSLINTTVKS